MTDASTKQTAEATQTLKAHLEANVRYAQFVGNQELFCFLDTTLNQVLVRSLVESLAKKTKEVIPGEAGLLGNLVQAERVIEAVVNKLTGPAQSLKRLQIG